MTIRIEWRDGTAPLVLENVQLVKEIGPDRLETATFGNGPVEQRDVRTWALVAPGLPYERPDDRDRDPDEWEIDARIAEDAMRRQR